MKETTNYNLKKIELTDSPPDITIINPNWDAIDIELKAIRDADVAHKAESASKHIKESGSNENGNYIKFDDGTMICWFSQDRPITDYPVGNTTRIWTLPAAFIDNKYILNFNMAPGSIGDASVINYVAPRRSPGNTISLAGAFIIMSSAMGSSATDNWVAIGRWKV